MKKINSKLQKIISGLIFLIDLWMPLSIYSIIIKLFSNNIFLQKTNLICVVIIFLCSFSFLPNISVRLFGKTFGMFIFGVDIYDENEIIQNQKGIKGDYLYWFFSNKISLKKKATTKENISILEQ